MAGGLKYQELEKLIELAEELVELVELAEELVELVEPVQFYWGEGGCPGRRRRPENASRAGQPGFLGRLGLAVRAQKLAIYPLLYTAHTVQ